MPSVTLEIPDPAVQALGYLLAFALPALLLPRLARLLLPRSFKRVQVELPEQASPEWTADKELEKNAAKTNSIVREGNPDTLFPFCPSTGAQLPPISLTRPSGLPELIAKARKAQKELMEMKDSMERRMEWLGVLEAWEVENGEKVAWLSARGSGKTGW